MILCCPQHTQSSPWACYLFSHLSQNLQMLFLNPFLNLSLDSIYLFPCDWQPYHMTKQPFFSSRFSYFVPLKFIPCNCYCVILVGKEIRYLCILKKPHELMNWPSWPSQHYSTSDLDTCYLLPVHFSHLISSHQGLRTCFSISTNFFSYTLPLLPPYSSSRSSPTIPSLGNCP